MRMLTRSIVPLLGVGATLLVAGCLEHAANHCPIGSTIAFANAAFTLARSEPRNCPYTTHVAIAAVPIAIEVENPSSYYVGTVAYSQVLNALQQAVSTQGRATLLAQPDGSAAAQLSGQFNGNTTSPDRDSAWVVVNGADATNYLGWAIMEGKIDPNVYTDQALAGPRAVPAGASTLWQVVPSQDTNSYLYAWRLDRAPAAGAAARSFFGSMPLAGRHTIGFVLQRSDYTADTVDVAVDVSLNVSIQGPGQLYVGDQANYSASVYGASGGVTHQWYENTVPQSTSAAYSTAAVVCGPKQLHLEVVDALGHTGAADFDVSVEPAPGENCS